MQAEQANNRRKHAFFRAQVCCLQDEPVRALKSQFPACDLAFVALFVSPAADFAAVVEAAEREFPDIDVVACTTAGEIGANGYETDLIIGVGFPVTHFVSKSVLIEEISGQDFQSTIDQVTLDRLSLRDANDGKEHSFAFLVVDGLSLHEDSVTAAIAPALRDMPMFGGSAGDGDAYEQTWVALNGEVRSDAAVVTLVQTDLEARVFSIDHLTPTDEQMVVTDADPGRRIVRTINAEPAAAEYARLVGKNPDELDQLTFASHPIVVRIGDTHHVRAIQQVKSDGELVFYAAIDEGMVLTVAKAEKIADHLESELAKISEAGELLDILGCDCILRRIEAEQIQVTRQLSHLLAENKVVGFSTYGEQIGPLHVNHTMTGVALYAPGEDNGA